MGIIDYIWPFERKFSQVPCAREAAIAALLGGPAGGAVHLMLRNKPSVTFKVSIYFGFGLFWFSFLTCRYQYSMIRQKAQQFQNAVESGKID